MKLFVIWPEKSIELIKLMTELKNNGHKILYWVGYSDEDLDDLPDTIFHYYRDASLGLPAKGIDSSGFVFPSNEIMEKLYNAESEILTMMNRLVIDLSVDERKHLYYHYAKYWYGVLQKYQPDAIIFTTIPHDSYDYFLYKLAHIFGIRTILFLDTRIPGRTLTMDDFAVGSKRLLDDLTQNKNKNFSVEELSEDVQKYYKKMSNIQNNALPDNIKYQSRKFSLIYKIKIFLSTHAGWKGILIVPKGFQYLRKNHLIMLKNIYQLLINIMRPNLKKEYIKLQSKFDAQKKFVYVPLQAQPEQSTSPQGGIFVDQIYMVEILSRAIPSDWVIYIKEHPVQWMRFGLTYGASRYRRQGYYTQVANIKNVVIVPVETASYDLIDNAQAVVTVTGAAGWEAMLRLKPSIIFGYPWYKDCPSILRAYDVESCRNAIKKIIGGYAVDQQAIINYLKSLDNTSLKAFIARSAGNGSNITWEESMHTITQWLVSELAK